MSYDHERLLELLADRALVGLGAREHIELAELLVRAGAVDVSAFDNAAAAVALASLDGFEAMPAALAARIEQSATAVTTPRPASDFLQTRHVDNLAPGFRETQDAVPARPPSSSSLSPAPRSSDTQDTLVAVPPPKQTQTLDGRRPPGAEGGAAPTTAIAAATVTRQDTRASAPQPQPGGGAARPFSSMPAIAPPTAHAPMPVPMPAMTAPARPTAPTAPSNNVVPFRAGSTPSRAVAVGGWIAAAACLLLAIGAFAFRGRPAPVASVQALPSAAASATAATSATSAPDEARAMAMSSASGSAGVAAAPGPLALRERLLAAAGTTRADWSPTKDPAGKGATGEVVWNKEQQAGVMRFRGLAKNDPSRGQYQLWIFDKSRDEKYPVDGGVFDVSSDTGDVVVAIHAALPVAAPSLFAVTLEKPGGVVVSKRDRLVVTAKPAG